MLLLQEVMLLLQEVMLLLLLQEVMTLKMMVGNDMTNIKVMKQIQILCEY